MSRKYLKDILKNIESNYSDYLIKFINPLSIYLLSDYYFGMELENELDNIINIKSNKEKKKLTEIRELYSSKNIYLENSLIDKIEDYNIIAIQGGPSDSTDWSYNFYDHFIQNILPKINKKITLIIGHFSLTHFINDDENIKNIINNDNVILCFLQNYGMIQNLLNIDKIKAFPFGLSLNQSAIKCYIDRLKEYHSSKKEKNININHLNLGPSWVGRNIFPKKEKVLSDIFYEKISDSKFLLSPCGDRWDTYRHYECIGLETVPICTKGALSLIFNDSMLYIDENINETYNITINDNNNDEEKMKYMVDLYNKQNISSYKTPNSDLITLEYWIDYIKNNINKYILQMK